VDQFTSESTGDVYTNDGLRAALAQVRREGGWEGPTGSAVIGALRSVAHRWIAPHGAITDPHRVEHLIGLAWEFLATETDTVLRARSPWSLLRASMLHLANAASLADELGARSIALPAISPTWFRRN
jgi:O-acetyl-ADP-ribose deacetylase (regulator of RNase III)